MLLSLCCTFTNIHPWVSRFNEYGIYPKNVYTGCNLLCCKSNSNQLKNKYYELQSKCKQCDTIQTLIKRTNIKILLIGTYLDDEKWFSGTVSSDAKINGFSQKQSQDNRFYRYKRKPDRVFDFLSANYVDAHIEILENAKYIYVCARSLNINLKNTDWITNKINERKIILNLKVFRSRPYGQCHYFIHILEKSKVIIGHHKHYESLINIFQSPKPSITVQDVLAKQPQHDQIIIYFNENSKVNWVNGNKKGSYPIKIKYNCQFYEEGLSDYFAAGFISLYYNEIRSIKKCIKEGCKWGEMGYKKWKEKT